MTTEAHAIETTADPDTGSYGSTSAAIAADAPTEPPPVGAIAQLTRMGDYVTPIALRVVCDLGIPDLLSDGPLTADEIADRTVTHPDSVYRLMRALCGQGLFVEDRDARFALTELSQLLRENHPHSVRRLFQLIRPELAAWLHFDHSVRTGEDTFAHVHGESYWSLMGHDEVFRGQFEAEIRCMTEHELRAVVPAYPWGRFRLLVDLGGGTGQITAGILRANPELRSVLFDLPDVAPHSEALLRREGVLDRCQIVSGNFFDSVPPGGDLYLLKRVFYDFSDEQAVAILRNVRRAMSPEARVITLDGVARSDNRYDLGKMHDLFVLGLGRGRCRTRAELADMFAAAGLKLRRVIQTGVFPLVEAQAIPDWRDSQV